MTVSVTVYVCLLDVCYVYNIWVIFQFTGLNYYIRAFSERFYHLFSMCMCSECDAHQDRKAKGDLLTMRVTMTMSIYMARSLCVTLVVLLLLHPVLV